MEKNDFRDRKMVARVHIIYWAIIYAMLAIFLLLIAPGRVNENALENFSFASSLISIVLAVVSIVYSFQSGKNASDSIISLSQIEDNINSKVSSLESLRDDLKKCFMESLSPISEGVSSLREAQTDVSKKIDQWSIKKADYDDNHNTSENTAQVNSFNISSSSLLGNIALYAAALSYNKTKAINPSIFNEIKCDDYMYGFLVALSCTFPDKISFNGSPLDSVIEKFDYTFFGDIESIREKILSRSTEIEEVPKAIKRIESFFNVEKENDKNETNTK